MGVPSVRKESHGNRNSNEKKIRKGELGSWKGDGEGYEEVVRKEPEAERQRGKRGISKLCAKSLCLNVEGRREEPVSDLDGNGMPTQCGRLSDASDPCSAYDMGVLTGRKGSQRKCNGRESEEVVRKEPESESKTK